MTDPTAPVGIRGWLLPVALGVYLTPVLLVGVVMTTESTLVLVLFVPVLAASLVTAHAFFRKRRYFPKLAIGLMAVLMAIALAAALRLQSLEAFQEFVRDGIVSGIWIAYLARSKRVEATFTT